MNSSYYDQDYYERGVESGKSCYQNYTYLPELTIPMAMTIVDFLGIKPGQLVLDYGCAKGYLVKALRLLNRESWGAEISNYALANVHPDVKPYCNRPSFYEKQFKTVFDFCIAKDVFEHIPQNELKETIHKISANTLFAIIPLGKKGKFFAKSNDFDKSHVICEDEDWWDAFLSSNGWRMSSFKYQVKGIKDNYSGIPKAHGFFVLRRKECL